MLIRIGNSISIGEGARLQISKIDGLASPAIRNGNGVYAGKDGGYMSSQFYGVRTIIVQGFYMGTSCDDANELRDILLNNLRIRFNYPIFITNMAGDSFYTEGYLTDLKVDIDTVRSGTFQITLYCSDPLLYASDGVNESSTWITQNISFDTETLVLNPGIIEYAPVFTLTGDFENPTLTNLTTGKYLTLDYYPESGADNTLVIDMKNRLITVDGTSINADRTIDSVWWSLIRGSNNIEITADYSGTGTAQIKLRKGYTGI